MAEKVAIKLSGVHKSFRLPHEKNNSIKSAFIKSFRQKKSYEEQHVLKDISFEVKKGEFFGIVGRNGSGKSTLLKLLAGIYAPDSGLIQVKGKLTPFIELGVGFNPDLTGKENVFLNGALLGFSRSEMKDMYDDIVEFAELERFMDQQLKNYSSGMQVRLAFSIAIRARTDILLIDEVLAVGDQSFQEKCFRYFSKIKQEDKTVVFVTHDMATVERYCDRVFILDRDTSAIGTYDVKTAVSTYHELNYQKTDNSKSTEKLSEADVANGYIKNVQLLDQRNRKKDRFNQGDFMKVRIFLNKDYIEATSTKNLLVGLAFYDNDNTNLAGPNSLGQKIKSNAGYIDYDVQSIPFNMGKYEILIAIYDEDTSELYDQQNREKTFFVNTPIKRHGKVVLDGIWKTD